MIVCKLGGSVITDKSEPETLDTDALEVAATAIGDYCTNERTSPALVLVHGGGSFGHHHASNHGVTTTDGTRDEEAIKEIHGAMKRLNRHVLDRLVARGVDAAPVHPFEVAHRDRSGTLTLSIDRVRGVHADGAVPVLHGDLVAHEGVGATVVSGDELVATLAATLPADRVGVCSTVPGVLDDDGAVVPEITSLEAVADVLGESEATDVTGGMAGKVKTLCALEVPASIFGLESLSAFLAGKKPGTTIRTDRR